MPSRSSDREPVVLTRATLIPIGVAAVVAMPLALVGWTAKGAMKDLEHAIETNSNAVELLRDELRSMNGEVWTRRDMKTWIALLRAKNEDVEGLEVPDPPVR